MLALLTYGVQAYSQDNSTAKQFSVAGVVYDDTGEPCIGATVRVKNEPGTGTITDLDGKFAIKVKAGCYTSVRVRRYGDCAANNP